MRDDHLTPVTTRCAGERQASAELRGGGAPSGTLGRTMSLGQVDLHEPRRQRDVRHRVIRACLRVVLATTCDLERVGARSPRHAGGATSGDAAGRRVRPPVEDARPEDHVQPAERPTCRTADDERRRPRRAPAARDVVPACPRARVMRGLSHVGHRIEPGPGPIQQPAAFCGERARRTGSAVRAGSAIRSGIVGGDARRRCSAT